MARRKLDDGLVHGQGAAALLRSIQEFPKRTRRAPPKDKAAMDAYYAEEAKRAGLDPQEVDAAAGTNTEATLAKAKRKAKAGQSIINTATRGDEESQSIATPKAFIHALEHRFGLPVDFDLAANAANAKAETYFTEEQDALKQDWSKLRTRMQGPVRFAFLNPPFGNIKPWALGPKDNPRAGVVNCRWLKRLTVMLVPASYSTDWFLELEGKLVRDAIPRIQFEGATHLYPKDLALIVAGFGFVGAGYWDWRVSYLHWCHDNRQEPDPVHLKGVRRLVDSLQLNELVLPQPDFNWTADPFKVTT